MKGSIWGHGGTDRTALAQRPKGSQPRDPRCLALPGSSSRPTRRGCKGTRPRAVPGPPLERSRNHLAARGGRPVDPSHRTCDARTRKVGSPNRASRRRVGGRDPSRHGLCAGAGKPESTRKPRRSRLAAVARRSESYTERGQPRARGGPRLLYPPSGWGPPGHSIPVGAGPRPAGQAGARVRRWGPSG